MNGRASKSAARWRWCMKISMPWFVYLVRCGDGSLYTGIATDVESRVSVHNDGRGARYTRSRRPVTLVYVERRRSRSSALKRELAIKALARVEKLALIARSPT
jgi:putative endonuclease